MSASFSLEPQLTPVINPLTHGRRAYAGHDAAVAGPTPRELDGVRRRLSPNEMLTGINRRWNLGMRLRRSWRLTRCVYDPDRNRDVSPWVSSSELSLWLDAFEVGLVYGWEMGAELKRKLEDETT